MGRRRIQRCNTMELKDLLLDTPSGRWFRPINSSDEVFPGVLLGDADTALSTQELRDLGVTHVLNAAQGHNNHAYGGYVNTSLTYYAKMKNLKFMGIPAMDMPGFYIRPFLRQAADFIHKALQEGGRVLVHCQCGISRSAALVCGFLMLKRGMNVQTALATIKKKRNIFPNQGFLSQLCDLDYELRRSGEIVDKEEDVRPASPVIDLERESSPLRNPGAYPRFSLIPSRVFETYTSTKNYVVPRRARSCERLDLARKATNSPLVDHTLRDTRSPQRALSPPRRSSVAFGSYDDEDEPEPPKVFDTYRRYARSVTSPVPPPSAYVSTQPRPYEPYVSPRTRHYSLASTPRSFYYDSLYSDPTSEYINNLNRYYDSYRYNRAASPFTAEGATTAPASVYRNYRLTPDRSYLVGPSYTNPSAYPYTHSYIPTIANYPSTYRTLSHATLSPLTSVWI